MKSAFYFALLFSAASPTPDTVYDAAFNFGKYTGYVVIGLFFGIGILYAIYDALRKWKRKT